MVTTSAARFPSNSPHLVEWVISFPLAAAAPPRQNSTPLTLRLSHVIINFQLSPIALPLPAFQEITYSSRFDCEGTATMPHPLEEWLPNDAPWARLSTAVLEKQCTIRNLPTTGHSEDLVQRLSAYSQAERNTSDIKRLYPWLTEPDNRALYQDAEKEAHCVRLQVVRVVDQPGPRRDSLRRDFEICDGRLWHNHVWEKRKAVTVSIDTVLQCDCPVSAFTVLFLIIKGLAQEVH